MRYLPAIVLFALAATLSAQTPASVSIGGQPPPAPPWDAPHLEFEVASVKVSKAGPTMMGIRTLPTGVNVTNLPLRMIITQAYRHSTYQPTRAVAAPAGPPRRCRGHLRRHDQAPRAELGS